MRAEAITRALGGRWHGSYGTARCPAHDDRNPSLSIRDGEGGRLLLYCHAGCAIGDIWVSVGAVVGKLDRTASDGGCSCDSRRASQSLQALIDRIWAQSTAIEGTRAAHYLQARGIIGRLPGTLRFNAHLRHPKGGRLPAMVARVDDLDGQLVALHRTFLDPREPRKTELQPNKAMLGPCKGAAVRLRSGHSGLAVAEGIETALSVGMGLDDGVALWAALSTSGMSGLCLPEANRFGRNLLIATDGDQPGRRAGAVLGDRAVALGWSVEIVSAPDGQDFNDLARRAANG